MSIALRSRRGCRGGKIDRQGPDLVVRERSCGTMHHMGKLRPAELALPPVTQPCLQPSQVLTCDLGDHGPAHRGIAWLTLDKPETSANVLSRDVLVELDGILQALEKDKPRGVVLRSGKSSGFIAGAEIKEFTQLENPQQGFDLNRAGQRVFDRL